MAGEPFLQSDGAVEVIIDGEGSLPGPWRTLSGGGRSSETIKIRPGHRLPEQARAGAPTTENVVVSSNYKPDVWLDWQPRLDAALNRGAGITAARMYMDARGQVFGRRRTYRGVITRVTPPEYDTDSDDAGDLEIEIASNADVSN